VTTALPEPLRLEERYWSHRNAPRRGSTRQLAFDNALPILLICRSAQESQYCDICNPFSMYFVDHGQSGTAIDCEVHRVQLASEAIDQPQL
jgi:hypothetical protein